MGIYDFSYDMIIMIGTWDIFQYILTCYYMGYIMGIFWNSMISMAAQVKLQDPIERGPQLS